MHQPEPVVRLRNVTKRIGRRTIIDNISLDVNRGEIVGLVGPNGAGKTTLIRMMVGLMSLTSGEITIEGRDIRREFEQAARRIGAIVENPEFYNYMSGYKNLVHYARMVPGIPKTRIRELVKLVKLEERIHDKVKRYSLGMRQRLGIAQALLHDPPLLVLDEPTNGLDPAGIRELREYLQQLAREKGAAIVVSSHLLTEMERMCDRVAVIQQGRLVDVRPVDERSASSGLHLSWIIETDAPETALHMMAEMEGIFAEPGPEGHVSVTAGREQMPEIVARLVSGHVRIYAVRPLERSLEDQFLVMTGGGTIG